METPAEGAPTTTRPLTFWKSAFAVFTGLWFFALSLLILAGIGWIIKAAQFDAEVDHQTKIEAADQIAGPDFLVSSGQTANLLRKEHSAFASGWAAYVQARDEAKRSLDSLDSEATTSREHAIALNLEMAESEFSNCAGTDAKPDQYLQPTPAQCDSRAPLSDIDKAFK
jgi:hypothetical protein